MKTSQKSRRLAGIFVICAVAMWGLSTTSQAQVVQAAVQTSAVTPSSQQLEVGPVLDVVPYVLSDGCTINLTLIPSLTEFNGYDNANDLPQITGLATVQIIPPVRPEFTVRQVITTVNIWDNQTIVLGGLISSTVTSTKDKVPMIGDLPLVGRLFQSQSKSTVRQNLMIFVTATIVDPAGNRVHSDDELPFAQSTVPPQPPGVEVQTGNPLVQTGNPLVVPAR